MVFDDSNPAPERKPRSGPRKRASAEDAQTEMLRRVPPNSPEAEQAVLAGILMTPEAMNTIADILIPDDFYQPANKIIFSVFMDLYAKSQPIDLTMIYTALQDRNQLESVGGTSYLGQIAQAVVTGANAEFYAGVVRAKAMQRNLISASAGIIENSYDSSKDVNQLLDESEQAIFAVSRRTARQEFIGSKQLLDEVFADLSHLADNKDIVTGVDTGYKTLNILTAGLQKSDLIIVAARPSMGKTAFALCLAINAALKQDITVGFFSLEMGQKQLMQRLLSIRSKVELAKIRRPSQLADAEWQDLYHAADVLSNTKIFIDDSSALTTMELRSRARRLKAEHGLDLLIIDYLQLMRASRQIDSRELEISEISRSLKALAKELEIPVVALSQLNRKVEDRTDKRPNLADLRESGAIEQDADVIMFIYRDDVYKFKNPAERPLMGDAEIIIGKQRNGPVGVAELVYVSPHTSFEARAPDFVPPPSEIMQ